MSSDKKSAPPECFSQNSSRIQSQLKKSLFLGFENQSETLILENLGNACCHQNVKKNIFYSCFIWRFIIENDQLQGPSGDPRYEKITVLGSPKK
jgi:hypothetical protein